MKNLWTVGIAACLALTGCDTDDSETSTVTELAADAGTEEMGMGMEMGMSDDAQTMASTATPDAIEEIVDGSYCQMNPATEDNSLCASIIMPEDAAGLPEKVSFHFFESLPPFGPPSVMGLELANESDMELFAAGAEVPMVVENLPSSGAFFIYAAVYMEGGGAATWITVPGVDYEGDLPNQEALEFTGAPINIVEPITLKFVE